LSLLDQRYRKDPSLVARDIAGEVILVLIRQNAGDLDSVYTLNETASFVWERLDGERTLRDVKRELLDTFEVDEPEAERDLIELMEQLTNIGVVEAV
jgi:hypothetical protein